MSALDVDTPVTAAEVREAVELAWTDATHLPACPEQDDLCAHLAYCAGLLDRMIDGAPAPSRPDPFSYEAIRSEREGEG